MGRFDLDTLDRKVPRDLVAEQHSDFVQELSEAFRRTFFLPHQGQLVLYQRMIDDRNTLHSLAHVLFICSFD